MLASGSKGNAIYISDGNTSILVDAGLSGREIERRLRSKGLSPENLDGIVVSHEHNDHIQGVGVLSRRYHLTVYMSRGTEAASASQVGTVHDLTYFNCGSSFQLNTLTIHPFSISHDAEDPSGFTINSNGLKIGIATDLGIATSMVKEHLRECYLLIIEANHDTDMLVEGPYPWFLKQRIKGRTGHLSNEDSNGLLKTVRHDRLCHVILAHLSEINNRPEIAQRVVGRAIEASKIKLTVARQEHCGEMILI
jgi:phosphoribosyl 1,2-cyclic phosphodiesterase